MARNCMSERRERVREVEMFEEVPRNAPSGKGLWRNETRAREVEMCKDEPQGTPGGSGSWKGKGGIRMTNQSWCEASRSVFVTWSWRRVFKAL